MHMGTTKKPRIAAIGVSVHPHAHGDNRTGRPRFALPFGSPPCTWGQHAGRPARHAAGRFTPMHMGTTVIELADEPLGFRFTPMHMGTTSSATPPISVRHGSPPCTWGQLHRRGLHPATGRFTPMHMGTTARLGSSENSFPVHPHAHGDNVWGASGKATSYGSPPCTWGQRFRRRRSADRSAVHPHAHGDNVAGHAVKTRVAGSPPCTWGQQADSTSSASRSAVHPHAHGDNAHSPLSAVAADGSPPCTWGQREQNSSHLAHIPVHPHAHGDNLNFRYS